MPAFAQDTFVGPRIEAQVGWDHGDVPDITESTAGTIASRNRVTYSVGLGYDWSRGHNVVAGIQGDADFGGKTGCVAGVNLPGDQLCGKMVHDLDIGARLDWRQVGLRCWTSAVIWKRRLRQHARNLVLYTAFRHASHRIKHL